MVRGTVAWLIAAVVFCSLATAHGQEESFPPERTMRGEFSGDEAFAEEEFEPRRQESYLMWLVRSLGLRFTVLLPLAGLVSFALTGVLVVAGKGKSNGTAIAFVVGIPFLVGIFGMLDGFMASFIVIASAPTSPKPSEIADGISSAIVTPFIGMLLMAPSYMLATIGLFIRSLTERSN